MTMGMGRKCSQCGKTGHNSRTCRNENGQSTKLFGVELVASSQGPSLDDGFRLRKSVSFTGTHDHTPNHRQMRKKGVPWSEEEHRQFLAGLQKLGKGDWKGISRSFVSTRTSTQVASHAQKYFLRQKNGNKVRKKDPQNQQVQGNCSTSISHGMFPGPVVSNLDCIYTKRKPYSTLLNAPQVHNWWGTQNSLSLELSLAAPQLLPVCNDCCPLDFWHK